MPTRASEFTAGWRTCPTAFSAGTGHVAICGHPHLVQDVTLSLVATAGLSTDPLLKARERQCLHQSRYLFHVLRIAEIALACPGDGFYGIDVVRVAGLQNEYIANLCRPLLRHDQPLLAIPSLQ